MKLFLTVLILSACFKASSQKIYGKVLNEQGEVLPYASITVKGTSKGTSANNKGIFSLSIQPGTYAIICQHIGYAAQEKTVVITTETEINFTLTLQKLVMTEVVVKTGGEDPAYEIIRQAIKKRKFYGGQVSSFTCDIYGKDVLKLRKLPKKVFGQKIEEEDKQDMGVDSAGKGILYLSESISKVSKQGDDKFKLEVLSSRVSGSGSFGFTFPSFISLYNNNVTVFSERFNPRGFISPIADGAIGLYRFKFLGTFYEDGKSVNSIQVIPRRTYEPLFSGIINITDDDWRIHSFDLLLTKTSQLEILDTLKISQIHVPVSEDIWRTKNQLLYFNFKLLGIDAVGNFLSVYSNYNISPVFDKKFFDRVIIKYDTAVNKRSITYWDSARAVPLEAEEQKDYLKKDSIYQRNKDSLYTQQSIDSLKKRQGRIKPISILWGGIHRTHYSKVNQYSWGINPIILNTEYNAVEGVAMNYSGYITRYLKKIHSNITFEPNFRYGFSNGHLNPSASVIISTRKNKADQKIINQEWIFSGGKRVSEFNKEGVMHPYTNALCILISGRNYIKIYENEFAAVSFTKKYESGLSFSVSSEFENRLPLENTTYYTFDKSDSINITPNYPVAAINTQFPNHQALLLSFTVRFKPGQRFIQLPNEKIPIGSKYPTFTFEYTKGIKGWFGSDTDFDKWLFTVQDDKNFKIAGKFIYRIGLGGFLNNKMVYIQDYKHFNRVSGRLNSFELSEQYEHSTTAGLYTFAHVEHHFNGLITNKIPLFKRLNWNLVGGANLNYVNSKENYIEVFAGLENIFKILRIDFMAGYQAGKPVLTGFRFSAGGILGQSMNSRVSKRGNTVTLEL